MNERIQEIRERYSESQRPYLNAGQRTWDDIQYLLDLIESLQRERQEPEPLSCDGCKHYAESLMPMCAFCTRIRSDRYEPKGEHHD